MSSMGLVTWLYDSALGGLTLRRLGLLKTVFSGEEGVSI